MYELHHLKGNTYYIDGNTNCGIYKLNDTDVVLIDTATQKEAPMLEHVLDENHLIPKYIVLTHSHADHSGACSYLAKRYHSKLIASKIERAFFRDATLDLGLLFGGYPLNEFDTPLMHIDDNREIYSLEVLPNGVRSFKLKGHHYGMIGIKTDDDVYFIADTLGSKDLVDKQHILLMYDVKGYLDTLDYLKTLNGKIMVPSHTEVTTDITELVEFNKRKIYEIMDVILNYLEDKHTLEDIVAHIFDHFNLRMSYNKYLLITSTIHSYVAYLANFKKIDKEFIDNKLFFYKIN